MRPHWTRFAHEIGDRLARAPEMLVATDLDGTLAELVEDPARACLHPAAARALRRLANLPRARLAVLSGRGVDDLAVCMSGIPGDCILAGNHGLELRGCGIAWNHPACAAARTELTDLAAALRHKISGLAGVELEDKGCSLTVHYRKADAGTARSLLGRIARLVLPPGLRRQKGKMVVEFQPAVEWHKGFVLRAILGQLGITDHNTIYLGDDRTDEDVFRTLRTTGITLHVGNPSARSMAALNASGPSDVATFLDWVADALSGPAET